MPLLERRTTFRSNLLSDYFHSFRLSQYICSLGNTLFYNSYRLCIHSTHITAENRRFGAGHRVSDPAGPCWPWPGLSCSLALYQSRPWAAKACDLLPRALVRSFPGCTIMPLEQNHRHHRQGLPLPLTRCCLNFRLDSRRRRRRRCRGGGFPTHRRLFPSPCPGQAQHSSCSWERQRQVPAVQR